MYKLIILCCVTLCIHGAFSAGIDFRRQILTSKIDPRSAGIDFRRQILTSRTFMTLSSKENTLVSMVYAKYFSAVRVKLSYLPLRELTL